MGGLQDKIKGFPKRRPVIYGLELNFDQGMAYDNMHFTPSSLILFAHLMAEELDFIMKYNGRMQ